jgi:uroporphyrinogen-III synthase
MAEPRLLLARPADRLAAAVAEARALGFDPLPAPLVEVRPLAHPDADVALDGLRSDAFAWAVLTSPTGVACAAAAAARRGLDLRSLLGSTPLAAVGPATAEALRAHGVAAQVPARHDSAGLVALLGPAVAGQRVALLRSDHGSAELPEGLAAAGASVLDAPLYALARPTDPRPVEHALHIAAYQGLDAAAFTSSLAVRHLAAFARELGLDAGVRRALAGARVGALGAPTARALAAEGFPCHVVAAEARFPLLLRDLRAALPGVYP